MLKLTSLNVLANRLFPFFIGITFLLFFTNRSLAQTTDSAAVVVKSDTVRTTFQADSMPVQKFHSPRKAAIFSAILPGLGQVYNKKYWKLPIIYAGTFGLIYSFQFNQLRYTKYRDAYKYRIDGDANTTDNYVGRYSDESLNTLQKYYHRYRDLTVIGFAALYALNIIDASVDAHLFTFDVSDDLSMHIQPTLIHTASINQYTTGLSFQIKF
jgi:Family of unknown function (DUF5683)